jgi:peptide chain release factor 3
MSETTFALSEKQIAAECERRRTFAIISHPDAGKTTLTEKLLLFGGAIQEAGSVKSNRAKAATSDWMELEKQRGISITSTCLQFEYEGHCLNLLDTPGHQDFSEDTYRTLAAADNAVMLIDAAKGLEPQTRKLLAVCRTRKLPLFTFINKLDRPSREPIELLDEIEKEFSLPTFAVNWPIGTGDTFMGVVDRINKIAHVFERTVGGRTIGKVSTYSIDDPVLKTLMATRTYEDVMSELEMLDGAGQEFDAEKILAGDLTPVFFGSAMNNFGVELFLQAFLQMGAQPACFDSNQGRIEPTDAAFSGFVFKLQANMDPRHRDRIAFVRVCSGVFEKDMTVYNSRTGTALLLSQPKKLFGKDRASIDTAFAGDIIGLSNPGSFSIGDTIAVDKKLRFPPIPSFAAELFAVLENREPSKHKHFHKGILALQEEGAIQILWLTEHDTRFPILAAVGQLQFEVVQFRMQSEYNVQTTLRPMEVKHTLWVEDGWAGLNSANRERGSFMVATDKDDMPVLMFKQNWDLTAFRERNPKLVLTPVSPGSQQVMR